MPHNLSIGELAERLARKGTSSTELTRHFLARIERLNPPLNAIITLTAEQRWRPPAPPSAAVAAGEGGPLLGMPLIHKDIFCTGRVAHHLRLADAGQVRVPL